MHLTIASATAELWRFRLDRPVGGSGVASVDVIVVELEADGLTALGFSYVLSGTGEVPLLAACQFLDRFVRRGPLRHPEVVWRQIDRSLNRLGRGPAYIALAAVDLALWDLYAKSLDCPVGLAMGGSTRSIKVYGSAGFHAEQEPAEAAQTARDYLSRGVSAVKPRVSGRASDRDLVRAVAEEIGSTGSLMLDANEKATPTSASWLCRLASEHGALFVEEPLPTRELDAYRALARSSGVAIAIGEHLQGLPEFVPFLAGDTSMVLQPDLAMMGGLTECLRVARIAEGLGVEVVPHFLPSVFVHLAAALPNVTWLEDFPLLESLFDAPVTFNDAGVISLPTTPGLGLSFVDGARQAFRIQP